MKKYLILFSLVILGVICVGAVSANQDVSVDGIHFNMISGFSENSSDSVNGIPFKEALNTYVKGDETIYIKVTSCSADNFDIDRETFDASFENTSAVKKTIKSHDGYYEANEEGDYTFSYLDGVKVVMITVPDEAYFEQIIK